jgi:hypothetical protein
MRRDHGNEYQHRLRHVAQLAGASPGELRAVARAAEWLEVPRGSDVGRAGVYFVVRGCVEVTSARRTVHVREGDVLAAGEAPVRAVAGTDATVVTIGPREWRALRALAPGVVAGIEHETRGRVRQNIIGERGRIVGRGPAESRAAMRMVCIHR